MNDNAKYIIVKSEYCTEAPIVFSSVFSHADVARVYGNNVVSAGFVAFIGGTNASSEHVTVEAYGGSTSLLIWARDEDSAILSNHLNLED